MLSTSAGKATDTDLTSRTTGIQLSSRTGSIAELVVKWTADSMPQAHQLVQRGAMITVDGRRYQVGRRERVVRPDGSVDVVLRCRSRLAKKLRTEYVVRAVKGISNPQWVKRAVKDAGGRAIVGESTVRAVVTQRGGSERSSTLKVIDSLASELGWIWAEADGLVTYASGFDIVEGIVPVAATTVDLAAGAGIQWSSWDSDDASSAKAGGTLELPAGSPIDPMTILKLTGAAGDNGAWLVDTVTEDKFTNAPMQVTVTRPRRPVARRRTARTSSSSSSSSSEVNW